MQSMVRLPSGFRCPRCETVYTSKMEIRKKGMYLDGAKGDDLTRLRQTKFHKKGEQKGNCFATSLAMITGQSLADIPEFEEVDNWHEPFIQWQLKSGIEVVTTDKCPVGFSLASGMSERGVMHTVVYFNGEPYADPHPSDAFLEKVDYYWLVQKA